MPKILRKSSKNHKAQKLLLFHISLKILKTEFKSEYTRLAKESVVQFTQCISVKVKKVLRRFRLIF